MQIVTTVVLIVAAVAVALFCDYLRNRSQQLDELAVELNVRNEMTVATPAAPARPVTPPAAAGKAAPARTARSAPAVPAELPTPPVEVKMQRDERHSSETVKPAPASATELTSVRGAARPRKRPLPPPDAAPLPRLDEMNPRQALSEWLDQRAVKTPARTTAPARMEERATTAPPRSTLTVAEPPRPAPAPEIPYFVSSLKQAEPAPVAAPPAVEPARTVPAPVVEEPASPAAHDIQPAAANDIRDVLRRAIANNKRSVPAAVPPVIPVAAAAPAPRPVPAPPAAIPAPVVPAPPVAAAAPAPRPVPAPAAVSAPAKTVSVFLSTRKIDAPRALEIANRPEEEKASVENTPAAEPRFEVIDGAAPSPNPLELVLAPGMHDHAALDRAIATGKMFRGMVVSVGINDVEGRATHNADLMQSIGYFLRGMLAEKEFACRSGEAEFLIVCPGLEGSPAQRRLNQIAEQLWDYQLRGLSTWSILFSWGGADVHHKRIEDAIVLATERMYQTRRGRKTVSVESLRPWRKVAT